MILAKKNNITKKFSSLAWDLLGTNKNGWVEVSGIPSENILTKKVVKAPDTGESKDKATPKVTENILTKKDETSVKTTEDIVPKVELTDDMQAKADAEKSVIKDAQRGAFLELASTLTKTAIKDYFDFVEVPYKQKDDLCALLFDNLGGDIELLKSKFSL